MMRTACTLAMLATATADSWKGLLADGSGERRQLMRGGGGRAMDLNVCGKPSRREQAGTFSATGTIHDDQTDEKVDCTDDPSCAGYGDNLNCHKTIMAPQGMTVQLSFTSLALEGGEASGCGSFGHVMNNGGDVGITACDAVQVQPMLVLRLRLQLRCAWLGLTLATHTSRAGIRRPVDLEPAARHLLWHRPPAGPHLHRQLPHRQARPALAPPRLAVRQTPPANDEDSQTMRYHASVSSAWRSRTRAQSVTRLQLRFARCGLHFLRAAEGNPPLSSAHR